VGVGLEVTVGKAVAVGAGRVACPASIVAATLASIMACRFGAGSEPLEQATINATSKAAVRHVAMFLK